MLLESLKAIKKRYYAIGFSVLITLIVVTILSSGGFIILVNKSNKEATWNITNEENNYVEITPKKGWKIQYVSPGDYNIELTANNQQSLYQKTINRFSFHIVNGQLNSQKESVSLGFQNTDCATQNNSVVMYYYCNKSLNNEEYISSTRDGINLDSKVSSNIVKPYNDGFLELIQGDSSQLISYSNIINEVPIKEITTQNDPLSGNQLVTDLSNPDNKRFIYYDFQNKQILSFIDKDDKNPISISLKNNTIHNKDTPVYIIGNNAYIFNIINEDNYKGIGHREGSNKMLESSIISVNLDTKKVNQNRLSNNIYYSDISISDNRDIFIYGADNTTDDKTLYQIKGNKVTDLKISNINDMCVNNNSVYLINDQRLKNIYKLSPDKRLELQYSTEASNLANINCTWGKVYFSSLLETNNGEGTYNWFTLSKDTFNQEKRTEDIIPSTGDPDNNILYSFIYEKNLHVFLEDDGNCNEVSGDTRLSIVKYLESLGIKLDQYNLNIQKEC